MRIFLIISFICSLAWALTTTPGWNSGNVVLNSITGTSGNLPITSTAGNPINIIPGASPAWNFNSTGHFTPNSNASVDIGALGLGLRDQYISTGSIFYRGSDKFIHTTGTDQFFSGRLAGNISVGANNWCSGAFACSNNIVGQGNAYGGFASGLISTSSDNTGFGANTLRFLNTGTRDVAVGKDAGLNTNSNDLTLLGHFSGRSVGNGTTSIGSSATLNATSSCIGATITGFGAGQNCTTTGLAIYGKDAGKFVGASAIDDSFFGESSGLAIDDGNSNSCFGKGSCSTTVSGNRNLMLGKNVNATSASASDELGIGTWIRGNSTTLDLKAFGTTGLSLDTSGNVFTPSSYFNINNVGNITSINGIATSWPSVQGLASTYFKNDGAGNLSWATDISAPNVTATTLLTANGSGGLLVSRAGGLGDAVALFRVTPFGAADDAKISVSMTDGSFNFTNRNDVAKTVLQTRDVSSVINDTLTLNGADYMMKLNGADLNSSIQLYTNFSGSTATDGMLMDFDGTNMTFNNQEGQIFNTASSFSFTGSELNLIDGNFLVSPSTDIDAGYTFNNATIAVSSSVSQIATTGALELQNNGGTGINFIASRVSIAGGRTESTFQRSCTLTSALAGTPINCLDTLDIGTGQVAYISGFRAKVNGATAWTGVVTCTIQDTAAVSYVDVPVANLTANAYINDSTVGAVLNDPFALGTGGTADNGIEIVCDSNGITGDDLVVTVYGVIK